VMGLPSTTEIHANASALANVHAGTIFNINGLITQFVDASVVSWQNAQ